jgi:hypothetical protein
MPIVNWFGFHLLRDGQLLYLGTDIRSLARKRYKEARRQGWKGRRWALQK